MSDFLDDKIKEINDRLKELKPLVEEHARLEKAADALSNTNASTTPRRRSTQRTRSSRNDTGSGRGRPRGSGKRAAEAERLVNANPGIAIPELADRMKIKANYLYRVMPTLHEQGKVRKEGKGWHPVGK